ncbi:MAG: 4'-phosphopantetheinyl transferase superfamily protein [Elusimicrobia bacterium]|nr:4'-phosphopantetheinyl transferase superfamily protein [Elusimicrobiota bacterium]
MRWVDGPAGPPLPAPDEVHVWRVVLPLRRAQSAECEGLLSDEEACRRLEYRSDRDRRRFAAGRGTLRRLLGRYLGVAPRELRLAAEPGGRPRLADAAGRARMRFNVSHSGDVVVLAFASGMEVGVDLEELGRDVDGLQVARQFFSPADVAALLAVPEARRHRAFMTLWTCKEAALKAVGAGLGAALDSVRVEVRRGRGVARIEGPGSSAAQVLRLTAFEPAAGYVAAVAVSGLSRPRARFWRAPGSP